MNACILLGQPTGWLTPNVRQAAKGIRQAAEVSFAFENFMLASDLLNLLKVVKLGASFGLPFVPTASPVAAGNLDDGKGRPD